MGYEILLTAIFHIGFCHKFRDQSSVKGLSKQWVEFQKVRAGRIFTTKISICVDRRHLYFFPDRKSTKSWTNLHALERKSVQKMVGFVMTECWKRKHRTKTVLPLVTGTFTTQCDFRGEKGRDLTQSCDKNPYTHRTILKATWQHKNATKTLITQLLRTDLGRSVGVTAVTQLVCLNRFTSAQPFH